MNRTTHRVFALCALLAAPARAEDTRRWQVAVEAGAGRIHHDDHDPEAAGRLFHAFGERRRVRAELGFVGSGYAALDLGAEFHPWPNGALSPFVGLGSGILAEEGYGGLFLRGTVGVEARLAPPLALRVALQAGTHGGQTGPHLATVGLGLRF